VDEGNYRGGKRRNFNQQLAARRPRKQEELGLVFAAEHGFMYLGWAAGKSFLLIGFFDVLPAPLRQDSATGMIPEAGSIGEAGALYLFQQGIISPTTKRKILSVLRSHQEMSFLGRKRDFQQEPHRQFLLHPQSPCFLRNLLQSHSLLSPDELETVVRGVFSIYPWTEEQAKQIISRALSRPGVAQASEIIKEKIRKNTLPCPQRITLEEMREILRAKPAIFYTGSGISKASGGASVSQLYADLGIPEGRASVQYLVAATREPQKVLEAWERFARTWQSTFPTPAHFALAKIARDSSSLVFSENCDTLHEKTGIKVIKPALIHLSRLFSGPPRCPAWLRKYGAIITIGLEEDRRGILWWYKFRTGRKIVAINLKQPSYLGRDDFWLQGDCQKILPALAEHLPFC
jgi:hypothetical protein